MADLDRADSAVVCFLELHGTVTNIFAYTDRGEHKAKANVNGAAAYHPSLSKLSKSPPDQRKRRNHIWPVKETLTYTARGKRDGTHFLTESITYHTSFREGCVLVESVG
jgi:hypothetical protein